MIVQYCSEAVAAVLAIAVVGVGAGLGLWAIMEWLL